MKTVLVILTLLSTSAAFADGVDIYESLDDIEIGRVFLTPQQRYKLDHDRRLEPPTATHASPAPESQEAPARTRQGFGYIVLHDGSSTMWVDGDFRPTSVPVENLRQTAGITIRSHDIEPADPAGVDTALQPDVPPDADRAGDSETGDAQSD
ncbi:MAG: hypothetical protein OEW68_00440 [Gammaproteobacteria bacterium]|nr:hypothetical protein [Gammaproteobacteria bacterium]MDH4313291.1 hypothetical protein [Gammaproteobacteria bacterium]MDH5212908.1 hypothetical protein [Gammaproteobacteria bacterium]